ncbi:MAG: secondary thiamine-phosphate synthase enzyme YjbQ [Caulobacteraceae bacterium]
MKQASSTLAFSTRGRGLLEITANVAAWVSEQGLAAGLLTLFCRHTSASLLIQENADPDVQTDLESFFETIAPEDPGRYVPRRRGAGRHALAPARRAHPGESLDPGGVRKDAARDLAGNLSVRAPPRAAPARGGAAPDRRIDRV